MTEMDLSRVTIPDNGHSLFICEVSKHLSPDVIDQIADAWKAAWDRAGRSSPPSLLVVTDDCMISPISDAELEKIGLMRIPA